MSETKKKRRTKLWTALILILGIVAALTAGFFAFDVASWQPLVPEKLTEVAQKGAVYDREGSFVTTLVGRENRTVVPLSSLPRHVVDAFLAAEDLRFYKHPGFDVVRIFGAVVKNVRSGGYEQGASTITQQLVKLSHLSSQKTLARKLEEVWLAVQLESLYTKEQILEMYLNFIYFGSGAYGVQAAAETTFGLSAAELSPAQSAALAAAIKAPSAYSLLSAPEENAARRGYILDTMLAEGMLSREEYDAAIAEELHPLDEPAVQTDYGWFVDAVLDEAEVQLAVSSDELLTGGYRIYTTLDEGMQTTLETQYAKDLFPANASDGTKVQSASACIDTSTGAVRAIVGGREYATRRGLNRATKLRRQPGSALKPLVAYAPAIANFGYTTASVIKDEPTNFSGYKPRNSGNAYYGNVTLRTAMKNSLNICAVSLLQKIGVAAGRDYLQKVGIPLDDRDWNLSLALGSMTYGVSPVQLAGAFVPFANGGTWYAPYFIDRITDADGRVVYAHADSGSRVLSSQNAFLLTSMMQTVTTSGTGAKLAATGLQVAGKTGTVNMVGGGNRDVWMAAYTADLAIATWMGFDNPDASHRLANRVSGGDNPAALCRDFLSAWYKGKTKPTFTRPKGIVYLDIDKKAVEWRGEAMLAGDLTPKAYRVNEVFLESNRPTKTSDVWTPPKSARSFYVTHNEAGYPLLVIEPSDNAVYRIQRDAVGESFILTELSGSTGQVLYYADTRAAAGVTYTYRVIPVHAELLNNGILLEGVQSVQVARAAFPSTGLQKFWDKLFGTGGAVPQSERPAVSMFTE